MKKYNSNSIIMPEQYADIANKKELIKAFFSTYYFNAIGYNDAEIESNAEYIFNKIKDFDYENKNLWKCIWFSVFELHFSKHQLTYHSSFAAGYRNVVPSIDDEHLRKVLLTLDICADSGGLFSIFPTYNIRKDITNTEPNTEYIDAISNELITIYNEHFSMYKPNQEYLNNEYFEPEGLFMESVTIHSLNDKMNFDTFINQYLIYLNIDNPYKLKPQYEKIIGLVKASKLAFIAAQNS